jgi:single-strand DNA-binding protein
MDMITIQILGRMVKDAEPRTFGSNSVAQFTIATDHTVKGEKVPDFMNCKAWGKTGEVVCNHFSKGARIFATGELTSRTFEGKTYWEVNVSTVSFVDAKPVAPQRKEEKKTVPTVDDSAFSLPFDL